MKMQKVGRCLVAGLGVGLLAVACSSKESGSGSTAGLDCPGVDGTYYWALIATGDCADQGAALQDQGTAVHDHGVVISNYYPDLVHSLSLVL